MDDKTLISVRNRNNGHTGYRLADGTREDRTWAPGETKKITIDELRRVSYMPGGAELLKDYLVIEDKAAIDYLNLGIDTEEVPEYLYSEDEIKKILLEGSLDELRDLLDFSPQGGIEIAKQLAVSLELPDTRKRKIISDATNFNIDNAISVNKIMAEDNEEVEEKETKTRRVVKKAETAGTESAKPTRRTSYKVVSKE